MKHLLATFILVSVVNRSFAQIDSLLARAKERDSFEEVFVHTDKNNYVTGETIWLKAYLYDGLYPSAKSSSIKIQVVKDDSEIVTEKVYPVVSGIATGNIKLATNLGTGRYFLRAFGNASVNETPMPYYVAPVIVNNPATAQKIDTVPYKRVATIQFSCPDGLVAGQLNQAYVTVADQYGQPIQTQGYLLNAGNDTVASFKTNYLGIDELQIIPAPAEKYTIILTGNTYAAYKVPSSMIREKGISMIVYNRNNIYNILLNATPDMAGKYYTLLTEYNYGMVTTGKVRFKNNGALVKIPSTQLPAGIVRLALLNTNNDAVCTRYIFSSNTSGIIDAKEAVVDLSHIDTAVSSIKLVVNDTAENTLSVSGLNGEYNIGSFYKDENIVNRFLLTGWFKEYNPALNGLIDNLPQADVQAINGLLATREISKPSWQKIKELAEDQSARKPVLTHINIQGTITPEGYKRLPKNPSLNLVLSASDSSRNFSIIPLGSDGAFEMGDLVYSDSLTVYYQLISKIPSPVNLDVKSTDPFTDFAHVGNDMNFMGRFAPVKIVSININQPDELQGEKKLQALASYAAGQNELANVTVHSVRSLRQKMKDVNDRYTTSVFMREASQEYDLVNNPYPGGAMSAVDYLRLFGRRMQVPRKGESGNIQQMGAGFLNNKIYYTLFLDEGQVMLDVLEGVDLSEVALIKIYDNGFLMSTESTGGPAIAIYTRKGSDRNVQRITHMKSLKIAGYNPVRGFVNPTAQNAPKINRQSLSGTFYWNPYLNINRDAQGSIEFCNINSANKAIIVMQGMAADGKLIYWKQTAISR